MCSVVSATPPVAMMPGFSAYSASKLAQTRIGETFAAENPNIITFNVNPGMIQSAMWEKSGADASIMPMDAGKYRKQPRLARHHLSPLTQFAHSSPTCALHGVVEPPRRRCLSRAHSVCQLGRDRPESHCRWSGGKAGLDQRRPWLAICTVSTVESAIGGCLRAADPASVFITLRRSACG